MKVSQIYELMNTVTKEVIGEEAVLQEDLSNVVEIGKQIQDLDKIDNYVNSLVNHIGKVIFVNRPYSGSAPSVLMDGWEYGSILEKVTVDSLPQAVENESWELEDGTSYDPNIFYKPQVSAEFFNKRVTFEIDMSFTKMQVKESFSNAEQLNAFISMIYNAIDKSMTVKTDELVMRTINNMIGETLHSDFPTGSYNTSGVKAVNLLYLYNQKFGTQLTKDKALTTPEFIRFASFTMGLYQMRMSKLSTLFNIGKKPRFTSPDLLHVVLLADFAAAAPAYLQSDTYHDEFVKLPKAEIVPCWQGSGNDYGFSATSSIKVKTSGNNTVELDGILGVMFDRDALGVCNYNRRVESLYNPKAEFWNNFYKMDAGYFNSQNENFVVYYMADAA